LRDARTASFTWHETLSCGSLKHAHLAVLIAALSNFAFVIECAAQGVVPIDTMSVASRLRDARDFAGATSMLRAFLAHHPENGDAARLLVETLYWQKDEAGAREVAESSLSKHPEDTSLRLLYGRILFETGQDHRAREVLEPVLGGASRGRADALLGQLAYWKGDLSQARRRFADALRADPAQPDARKQLGEILVITAPWLHVSPYASHDDQPINALGGTVDGGIFATPLTTVMLRVEPRVFRLDDSATRTVSSGELALASYIASAHTEVEIAGGGLLRSFGVRSDWSGRAGLGFRLPVGIALRARAERAPYLFTEASLSTPVMTSTGTAMLDWASAGGWLGQAAVQQQRYPDANRTNTVYAWLLAPIVHDSAVHFQIGYAFTTQNALQSRFVLAHPTQPFAPSDPRYDFSGRYVPYYTPLNLIEHSALAAMMLRLGHAVIIRSSGSYGFRATDDAIVFAATPGSGAAVTRTSVGRSFSPWSARASLECVASSGMTLGLAGDFMRTAFYSAATLRTQLTYRFGIPARRAAAGY
jgi:tetratricopeptide (TPR) repeat protein